jgi:soluble lytic murein transglycosylase
MQRQSGQVFGDSFGGLTNAPPEKSVRRSSPVLTWLRRYLPIVLLSSVILLIAGLYFGNRFWIHRYDAIIQKQAAIYRLDPELVWSLIHEETYFQSARRGDAGEVGLMQITPAVAKEWAKETGMETIEKELARDHVAFMSDPERNIQIGCWYLEKLFERYRDLPEPEARVLAAYNAGPSRVTEWDAVKNGEQPLTEEEFIRRIDIASTREYVRDILRRYRYVKQR